MITLFGLNVVNLFNSITLDYSSLPIIEKRLDSINDLTMQIVIFGEAAFWCRNVEKIIKNESYEDFNYAMYKFFHIFIFVFILLQKFLWIHYLDPILTTQFLGFLVFK